MLYDYATGDLAPEERGGTAAERFADNLAAIALARALKGEGAAAGGAGGAATGAGSGGATGARQEPTDAERATIAAWYEGGDPKAGCLASRETAPQATT